MTGSAEDEDVVVARFNVPPERAVLRLGIHSTGAVRTVSIMRWGNVGRYGFGYIPFGGVVRAERRFGNIIVPSEITLVGGTGPLVQAVSRSDDPRRALIAARARRRHATDAQRRSFGADSTLTRESSTTAPSRESTTGLKSSRGVCGWASAMAAVRMSRSSNAATRDIDAVGEEPQLARLRG